LEKTGRFFLKRRWILWTAGWETVIFHESADTGSDIRMNKKVRHKKLNASVKPAKAVPKIPAGKWTSTIDS
jgi:hypothetical protein